MQKNPHIDRIIDFVAKFAPSLTNLKKLSESTSTDHNKTANGDSTVIAAISQGKQRGSQDETQSQQSESTLMECEEEEDENLFLIGMIDQLIEVII